MEDSRDLRLGCGCLVHFACVTEYIRIALGDKEILKDATRGESRPGIRCPYYCANLCEYRGPGQYFMTAGDLARLVEYGEEHKDRLQGEGETSVPFLSLQEVEKLRLWLAEAEASTDEIDVLPSSVDDETQRYICATTKPCPKCGYRASHFHGHACHHISPGGGCLRCKTAYCYRCSKTGQENEQERGDAAKCLCGSWSNFCEKIKTPRQVKLFLRMNPFPHDWRCGCAICPDCSPGQGSRRDGNCGCDGNCSVCRGYVRASPRELGLPWEPQTPQMVSEAHQMTPAQCLFDSCQAGDLEDALEVLALAEAESVEIDFGATDYRDGLREQTYLGHAIVAGNLDLIRWLIGKGCNVSQQGRLRGLAAFPVHLAASKQRVDILRVLEEAGADLCVRDRVGRSALVYACEAAPVSEEVDVETVQFLLSKGICSEQSSSDDGNAATIAAALLGKVGVVHLLMERLPGFDINKPNAKGKTMLHMACSRGQAHVVKILLAFPGVRVDLKDSHGKSPIFAAAGSSSPECVELLLTAPSALGDIDINATEREGWTAVHMSCQEGSARCLQRIKELRPAVNLNAKGKGEVTPLSLAASCGMVDCVTYLLSLPETEVNASDEDGNTALFSACRKGHADVVSALVAHPLLDPNKPDKRGRTPLYQACHYGMIECLNSLVRGCVSKVGRQALDVNRSDREDKFSPLHAAVSEGHPEVLKALVALPGIDLSSLNKDGLTAFHLALKTTNVSCAKVLADTMGFDQANSTDAQGLTALHRACKSGEPELVSFLLTLPSLDANKKTQDETGNTPLHVAVDENECPCVELLLAFRGLHATVVNNEGQTACHVACVKDRNDALKLLLENKGVLAGVNAQDNSGSTALAVACAFENEECIRELLACPEVDVNLDDNDGATPLHKAAATGNKLCLKLLLAARGIDINRLDAQGTSPVTVAADAAAKHLMVDAGAIVSAGEQFFDAARIGDVARLRQLTLFGLHERVIACAAALASLPADQDGQTLGGARGEAAAIIRELGLAVQTTTCATSVVCNWRHPKTGRSPLMAASGAGKVEAVRFLSSLPEVREELGSVDKEGNTALHLACAEGRTEVVASLLSLPGIDSEAQNNSGVSPFEVALRCGSESLGCVALLTDAALLGGDPNRSIGRGPLTALGVASEVGNLGAVKLLVSLPGIDVNLSSASASASSSGEEVEERKTKTPLHLACEAEAEDVVAFLVSQPGVLVNAVDRKGRSALYTACLKASPACARALLANPVVLPNLADKNGVSPLAAACAEGNEEVVDLLVLAYGVDVNQATPEGRTPVFFACAHGQKGALQALLSVPGVLLDTADIGGMTALGALSREEMRGMLFAPPEAEANPGAGAGATAGSPVGAGFARASSSKYPPLCVGDVVVRGPQWRWQQQDHHRGQPSRGTVVRQSGSRGWWTVRWESGSSNSYEYQDGERHIVLAGPRVKRLRLTYSPPAPHRLAPQLRDYFSYPAAVTESASEQELLELWKELTAVHVIPLQPSPDAPDAPGGQGQEQSRVLRQGEVIEVLDEGDAIAERGTYYLADGSGAVHALAPGILWEGPTERLSAASTAAAAAAAAAADGKTSHRVLGCTVSVPGLHRHPLTRTLRHGWNCDGALQPGGCRSGRRDGEGFRSNFSWYCEECT